MKFKKGPNRFRILDHAVTGYEYWNLENKPIRQQKPFDLIPEDIKLNDDGSPSQIRHFWAFPVWNYQERAVQILEITQSTIQRAMKFKIDNRQGDALGYDFIITRTGDGFNTEYDIDTSNPTPLSSDIAVALHQRPINFEALFDRTDPFNSTSSPEAQKASLGFQKFRDAAETRLGANHSTVRQNEPPIASDIAEEAARLAVNNVNVEDNRTNP